MSSGILFCEPLYTPVKQKTISYEDRKEMTADEGSVCMSALLSGRNRVSLGGVPIRRFPASAKDYPSFLSWWFALGKPRPDSSKEWFSISGPGVVRGRTELISVEDWASLEPAEAEALREWIEQIPCGVLYD